MLIGVLLKRRKLALPSWDSFNHSRILLPYIFHSKYDSARQRTEQWVRRFKKAGCSSSRVESAAVRNILVGGSLLFVQFLIVTWLSFQLGKGELEAQNLHRPLMNLRSLACLREIGRCWLVTWFSPDSNSNKKEFSKKVC
jgi:hypothetical protein